jgi:hypothetical protein
MTSVCKVHNANMTHAPGDEILLAEATRVFEQSDRVLGLRGLYYQLVRQDILLNLDDEWQRLVQVVYASPLARYFKWKPLRPGATQAEPDLS